MKFKKLILVFILSLVLSGCSSNNIKEINYKNLEKLLNNNETFILEIKQTGCHNCESFEPKFNNILKQYNIKANSINTSNISDDENEKLKNLFNITGTPTVIFIKDGKEEFIYRRIVGDVSKDIIISKLKASNYIK